MSKPMREISEVLNDKNIVGSEKFHEVVDFTFKHMAESIANTLGPGGGYTMVSNIDAAVPVYPTKDGFTVVSEYKFNDQLKFFISLIIMDISKRMNNELGDSTTSGIIIGYRLYELLKNYDIRQAHPSIGCILPPISFISILEEIRIVLEKVLLTKEGLYILKNMTRERENDLIRHVAKTSSNNNLEIANRVADLYIKRATNHVYITVEQGTGDETIVEEEMGFEFGAGFIDPVMANHVDRITCRLENPHFFLVNGPLTENDLPNLNKIIDYVIYDKKKPLVIVAKDYDQPVRMEIQKRCIDYPFTGNNNVQYQHAKEPLAALMIDTGSEKSKDRLEDLRIILGCNVADTRKGKVLEFKNNVEFIEKFLGSAAEFKGTQLSTRIRRGAGDQTVIHERIKHIEERIKEIESNEGILAFSSVESHKRRIAMLNSDMNMIKVGGVSDKERRAKKLIYDDVKAACESATTYGFSLGGNVSVSHAIKFHKDEIINEVVTALIAKDKHVIVGNDPENLKRIISDILEFVDDAFSTAYLTAVGNMVGKDTSVYNAIVKSVYEDSVEEAPAVFNLVSGKISSLSDDVPTPIVPGNTDLELMSAVFGTVGNLVASNQFLSVMPGDSTIYNAARSR